MKMPWEKEENTELAETVSVRELGSTGQGAYGSLVIGEYNADLIGLRGIDTYDKMRKGDGQVKGILRIIKAPIMSAQWYVEPASESRTDIRAAEFVEWALGNMSRTWDNILREILSSMDFGFYVFEKVYEYSKWEGRTVVKWKKWGPRHPRTIIGWNYDANGGVNAVKHNKAIGFGFSEIEIPVKKILIFTIDEEAGNPEGTSILRPAYKHWFYKDNLYKVDAIQKERHGIGIPEVALPPNFTAEDKTLADNMAKNLRTNEQAFVVRPQGFEIGFIETHGNPVDALASAQHHDLMIARNVLAQFLNIGSDTSGSRATAATQQDIFIKSLRSYVDMIRGVINRFAIPQLVDYNFRVSEYPTLKVRRIGENADWRAFSIALRNLVESGVITPEPELEEWLREQMDLPKPSSDARDRTVEIRTAKKAGDYSNRIPKPADGG